MEDDVGFRQWLGVQYREVSDERAVIAIPLTAQKRNIRGVAHGGVVASLLDIAMGTVASGGNYLNRRRLVVTLEMKVNYLAPGKGDELVAIAETIRGGSRTVITRCDVFTDRGEICATGLGTFIVRRPHNNDPIHLRDPTTGIDAGADDY
ncbi:PaaI family thioesterase [Pseudorhodoplanes sp.]|uniref:PaaI family thioesterase n=1 Tax=Pseudorhodoplanes sp. TaxID=1934341 RepID=UPI003D10E25F